MILYSSFQIVKLERSTMKETQKAYAFLPLL